MIPNITRGSSFAGALRYDLAREKGHLIDTNCASAEADGIAREMDVVASSSRSKQPVHHVSLRCPQGETLTDKQWREVCEKYRQKMGFEDNQFAATRHFDKKEGDHIHIVINRVSTDNKLNKDFQEKRRSQTACREIEKEMGLERLEDHQISSDGRMNQVKNDLQDSINDAKGKGLDGLSDSLKNRGYELILHTQSTGRVQGASLKSLVDGKTWKVSEVQKGGLKSVEKQLAGEQYLNKTASLHKQKSNFDPHNKRHNINNLTDKSGKVALNINSSNITSSMIAGADKDTAEYLIYLKKLHESKRGMEM